MAERPNPLLQLLAATAALTGVAHAQTPAASPSGTEISVRASDYDEDALGSTPLDGSDQRYGVRTQQFQLLTPLSDSDRLSVGLTHEVMSGSSPWFSFPDASGRPLQIMSGATIHEERQEIQAAWTRDGGGGRSVTLNASYSAEDDYHAVAVGGEWARPLTSALTLGLGGSYSHDLLDPTGAAEFNRIDSASKNTLSAFGSLSLVLDRSSVLQAGLQLTHGQGFLSDPYKRFYAGDRILADARPDVRTQGAALLRYRRAFADADAALHADYRYAQDSWGVRSHTFELQWYQTLGTDFRVIPGVRYYTQGAADFYAPFAAAGSVGRYHSSDYRLAAGGGVSASLDLRKSIGAWELVIGIERHRATSALGFGDARGEDPGRVSYTQMHAGFDYHFE